jgi:ubiquinone/menaquinone biosynthesis C-methylase UbiE
VEEVSVSNQEDDRMSEAARYPTPEGWVPLPPLHLARRAGITGNPLVNFDAGGLETKRSLLELLPDDWSFDGKRVLEFGCGAGRILRHFLEEARVAEVYGCDIDEESIAWLEETLSPPLHFFLNGEKPPLPQPDETFDLIWAQSVFTHLTDDWSSWLLELHRVMKRDGLVILTFVGRGMQYPPWEWERWDEDRIGMNVVHYGQSWDLGGPQVFHSPWWLREHWGRAFEIVTLWESGFNFPHRREAGQGAVVMRKKPVTLTREDLERINPDDSREILALQHNIEQLHFESKKWRDYWTHHTHLGQDNRTLGEQLQSEVEDLRPRVEQLDSLVEEYESSLSWRLTRPMRAVRALLRRLRPGQSN